MMRILLIALLGLTSCAPVYVPNVRNSPMFTKAGEFQGSLQVGNGVELQAAVAVTNHLGIMGNYSFVNASDPENEDDYVRHKIREVGIGYFTNPGNSFFEVFFGYGNGEGTSFDTFEFIGSQTTAATGRYERYFLQPAFGVNKERMHFSFAPRFCMVDFYEFSNDLIRTSIQEDGKFFFEPAIVGRYNFANNALFGTFQLGASLPLSDNIYFDRRTFQLAFGFGFRIGGAK